jgi:chromate transporter
VWVRIALSSFGGPAGQIAVMHRILVEERRWVSESRFLHALNYCMLLPGPEAQQLATYLGWVFHRTLGGVLAGALFVLPGFLSILLLSVLYAGFHDLTFVQALFWGLKPAVVAVVIQALLRIGKRSLGSRAMLVLAAAAFVAIFFFQAPFPLIVAAAGFVGFLGGRVAPERFLSGVPSSASPSEDTVLKETHSAPPEAGRMIFVAIVWLAVWLAPIAVLLVTVGPLSVYTQEALFFGKAAVVSFGGAYSVLAYVAQECVNTHRWVTAREMLDGLGMAETTPGPLIMVVQFVGFLGAYRNAGTLDPMAAGFLGSVITAWVTFAPSFLWIFLGAPFIETLRGRGALNAALSGITAAVVGVILNLTIWFSLHTLFGTLAESRVLGARLLVPDWATIDMPAAFIAVAALGAMLRFKVGMMTTLAASVVAGLAFSYGARAF